MARRNSPPTQDVPQLIGPDERITVENILAYWEKRIVPWNYSPVNSRTTFIINHCRTRKEASSLFTRIKHDAGRKNNMEVAAHLYDKYHGSGFQAHEMSMKRLNIRKEPLVETLIRPAALLARKNTLKILINQPRQRFRQSPEEWALYAWIIQRTYATGDEAGIEIEFFDASVGNNGERDPRSFSVSSLPPIDPKEALGKMEMFVRAFDRAFALAPASERRRRTSRGGERLPLFTDL